ncbi:hypothetical protein NL108_008958 [Boleophthalmus pectinirostris]|nr:hypothetical protein NL108_008958 [Boleophthalmus pectinirostris]
MPQKCPTCTLEDTMMSYSPSVLSVYGSNSAFPPSRHSKRFTTRNHSPILTHIHTHSHTSVRRLCGQGRLSVLPKDTTTAFIYESWNHTSQTCGSVDLTAEPVMFYVESWIRTSNLQISGRLLYQSSYKKRKERVGPKSQPIVMGLLCAPLLH